MPFSLSSDTTVGFNSNETPITGQMCLPTKALFIDHDNDGLFETAPGEALNMVNNDDVEMRGYLTYELID